VHLKAAKVTNSYYRALCIVALLWVTRYDWERVYVLSWWRASQPTVCLGSWHLVLWLVMRLRWLRGVPLTSSPMTCLMT